MFYFRIKLNGNSQLKFFENSQFWITLGSQKRFSGEACSPPLSGLPLAVALCTEHVSWETLTGIGGSTPQNRRVQLSSAGVPMSSTWCSVTLVHCFSSDLAGTQQMSEDCWGSRCHSSGMPYAFPSSTLCVTHKQKVWCLWDRLSAPWHQWQSVSEVEYRSRQRAPKGKVGVLLLSEIWLDLHFFSQSLCFDQIFNCCLYFLQIVNYILKKDRLTSSLNKILGCIFKFSYAFFTF